MRRRIMIARIAIATIALGLLLLAAGTLLSEGYSAKRGFLESLPMMKVRLTTDEQVAQFFEVANSETAAGPLIRFEGKLVQMHREMEGAEVNRVLESLVTQRLGAAKPEHKFLFAGWSVQPGTTVPLGPVLAIASALAIIGAAVLIGARARHHRTASTPTVSAEQTTPPEPSQVQTSISRSRWRFALHCWGGVCAKAAADVSGILKVRGGRDVESASAVALGAGFAAALLLIAGYYLSYQLVSALDKSSLSPRNKKTILILLPIAYLVGAILLGGMVGLVTGTAR